MRSSRFVDHGLRVLAHLGQRPGSRASISEIAAQHGLSAHHLGKVVHALKKAGYLRTIRGHGGGLELARPPDRIRLGEVVRQLEPAAAAARRQALMADAFEVAWRAYLGALDRYTISDALPVGPNVAIEGARAGTGFPAPGTGTGSGPASPDRLGILSAGQA